MDRELFKEIFDLSPQFNEDVANGIAVKECQSVERHIDDLWRCAQESFPPGLKYIGHKRCSPKTEYLTLVRKRHGSQAFELARSDTFMCEYKLRYNDTDLDTVRIALPYVSEAGGIYIRGSNFYVYPVLADQLISVGESDLFIPFNRDKLTFARLPAHYKIDGVVESDYVYWSDIHHNLKKSNSSDKNKTRVTMKSPLFLYMFCKYGVLETFRRMGVTSVNINHVHDIGEIGDGYKLCTSLGNKPLSYKDNYYTPTDLAIVIPETDLTPTVRSLIATFFYIADYFTNRISLSDLNSVNLWKILLGEIVFRNKDNTGKLIVNIDQHLTSVEGYLDTMIRAQLAEIEVYAKDIYELFTYIVTNFSRLLAEKDITSIYDKRLTVLRYLLFDITRAINQFVFKLQPQDPSKITVASLNKDLKSAIKTELMIMDISGSKHGEVTTASYPGDNKIFKITGNMVLQESATNKGGSNKKNTGVSDPTKFLSASIASAGSLTNQPKHEPTGKTRANPFIDIRPNGVIYQHPDDAELLNDLQNKITRR